MKIKINAQELHNASVIAKQVVLKASKTLPITQYMQIKAHAGEITIRSTDMEKMVWTTITGDIIENGETNVLIKLIETFTRKEKGAITIETNHDDLPIAIITGTEQGGSATLEMTTSNPKDQVPEQAFPNEIEAVDLGPDFTQALTMAITCAAKEESRPVLTGILIDGQEGGKLALASADGFRLCYRKLDVEVPEMKAIIPGNTARMIIRTMGRFDKVSMWLNKETEQVMFKSDGVTIISQLIRGIFPSYLQLIPTDTPNWTFECSAPLLQQRLNQYAPDGSGIVRLSCDDTEPALKLSMGGIKDHLSAYTSLVPATLTGDKTGHIAVNQFYLTEAIKLFSVIKLEVTMPSSPCVMTGDIEDLKIVIMPMFVQW